MPAPLDSALAKTLLSGAAGVDVDRAAVEAAVNQQLIHGGTLDTLLLEAGVVDEATVAAALSQAHGTAPIDRIHLDDPDERAVALLPKRMAVTMGLVPFAIDGDDALHVACKAPLDRGLIDEVGALIKTAVVAHVVPEVRVVFGLAAAYDAEPGERFVALARQLGNEPGNANTALRNDDDGITVKVNDEPIVGWDLVEAMAHLAAQDSRDGIARVAVTYARRFLPFAAVFGVRDNAALGWHRSGPAEGLQFSSRPLPIPDDSFLAQALSSPSPVLLKPDVSDGNAAVFGWLGRRRPKTLLVVPIVVARRPVGALYADGGIRQRDPREVGELVGFGARLGPAFESLLRQRHRAHPSLFPQPAMSIPPMPAAAIPPLSPTSSSSSSLSSTLPDPPPLPGVLAPPPSLSIPPSLATMPGLPPPPPMPAMPTTSSSSSAAMPAISAPTGMFSPPKDGSSPFAKGYSVPPGSSTLASLPAPPPMPSLSSAASSGSTPPSQAMPSTLPRSSSASRLTGASNAPIVLTGIGAPLNEHLPRTLAASSSPPAPSSSSSSSPALFKVGDHNAPQAWRGALTDTVEKGLQGGSVDTLDDKRPVVDDDDLNWEAVVYDPAHAQNLDRPSTGDRAALDFPSLSSSTLADLYGSDASLLNDDSGVSRNEIRDSAVVDNGTIPAIPDLEDSQVSQVSQNSDSSGISISMSMSSSSAPSAPANAPSSPRDPPLSTMSHKDLVELLFAGDVDLVTRAARELTGRGLAAVPALGERFPGRLRVDPFDPGENVRTAAALGPLVDVLARLGNDGLDAAVTHVESRYPAHRFAAVLLFALTPDTRAMDLLRNRLHDAEPRIQRLAAEALVPFLAHPRFESLLVHLRERASASTKPYPIEARRRATELLGEFRDVGAVPLLMSLLNVVELTEPARQALRAITLQDFGSKAKSWDKWWQKAKKRTRLDWLIDGLSSEELVLRGVAHRELADLAGDDFGYRADGDKRARQRAVEVWQQWWLEEQRRAPQPKAAART